MKGKKIDTVFISQFIQESIGQGDTTPDQIVLRAKKIIEQIDVEIKEVENKKSTRSKLLDVIFTFEKQAKDKTEEAKLLSFFRLEDMPTCKIICDMVKIKPLSVNNEKLGADARFAIKQLLECKVLARETITDCIICGDRFDEYIKFVLRQ